MAFCSTNACCLCVSLRTGCLIIGWLITISSLYYLVQVRSKWDVVVNTPGMNGFPQDNDRPDIQLKYNPKLSLDGVSCVNLITGACLLFGTYKGKKDFLLPYMISAAIELAIFAIILIVLFCASGALLSDSNERGQRGAHNSANVKGFFGAAIFIIGIPFAMLWSLYMHLFLVVKSYHQMLSQSPKGSVPHGTVILRSTGPNQLV